MRRIQILLLCLLLPLIGISEQIFPECRLSPGEQERGKIASLTDFPPAQDLIFSADVRGSRRGCAWLEAALFRKGEERIRVFSPRNRKTEELLVLRFSPQDADRIELSCKVLDPGHDTAEFRNLKFQEFRPEKAANRLEIVPGYQVCSIYINNCESASEDCFRAETELCPQGKTEFIRGLAPIYIPEDRQARGTLAGLQENTLYTLRIRLNDNGKRSLLETQFRTLGAPLPIARTVVLGKEQHGKPLVIREGGSPDGYIRYTAAPGVVIDGKERWTDALLIDRADCIILDGLTIRGGSRNGVRIENASSIHLLNCEISGYGRKGVFDPVAGHATENGKPFNYDSGICIRGGRMIRIERCRIFDPRGTANSWFHTHPYGPNAIFVGETEQFTLRYCDLIGSDRHRWNDVVEGFANGCATGGPFRDAEICGNFLAFANDDGIELDGGQINARFFGNRVEGTLCGISLAPNLHGPSWCWRNLFCFPGDETGGSNAAVKNMFSRIGRGRNFLFNNTIIGFQNGISGYAGSPAEREILNGHCKQVSRNNLIAVPGIPLLLERFLKKDSENDFLNAKFLFESPASGFFALRPASPGEKARMIPGICKNSDPAGAYGKDHFRDLPERPVPFTTDISHLEFSSLRPETKTVSLFPSCTGKFRIFRNSGSDFLKMEPSEGKLEPGIPVRISVSIDPKRIFQARKNHGAFSICLENGLSRVISVLADSRDDKALLLRDRKDVLTAAEQKRTEDELLLNVTIPKNGRYFLFLRTDKRPADSFRISIDNSPFQNASLCGFPMHSGGWFGFGKSGNVRVPFSLSAGRRTIRLKMTPEKLKSVQAAALTEQPSTLLLAPEQDLLPSAPLPATEQPAEDPPQHPFRRAEASWTGGESSVSTSSVPALFP